MSNDSLKRLKTMIDSRKQNEAIELQPIKKGVFVILNKTCMLKFFNFQLFYFKSSKFIYRKILLSFFFNKNLIINIPF